jgi:hypothetical protein
VENEYRVTFKSKSEIDMLRILFEREYLEIIDDPTIVSDMPEYEAFVRNCRDYLTKLYGRIEW